MPLPKQSKIYHLKIIEVGDGEVGKTTLLDNFKKREFKEEYKMTVAPGIAEGDMDIFNDKAKIVFWDFPGQERFDITRVGYYKGAKAALLVFDLTRYSTFSNLGKWEGDLAEYAGLSTSEIIYIGNKSDLTHEIKVGEDEFKEYVKKKNGLVGLWTSAKTGQNVGRAFEAAVYNALFNYKFSKGEEFSGTMFKKKIESLLKGQDKEGKPKIKGPLYISPSVYQ